MARQEQTYRGFIKGNAHGINGGSEGLDSSRTMMHSNPERGREGRLGADVPGRCAITVVWRAVPEPKSTVRVVLRLPGMAHLRFSATQMQQGPLVTYTPCKQRAARGIPWLSQAAREEKMGSRGGGEGDMGVQPEIEVCDGRVPCHPGTRSTSFSNVSSVHLCVTWVPGCCHCCGNSRSWCGVG